MKKRTILILPTLLFLLQSYTINAQSYNEKYPPYTLSNTEYRILHSETNEITYKLYISYPPNYHKDTEKYYPVIYLLDADYSFAIAKNATDHLSERNSLPEVIVVGIAYTGKNKYRINRTRDYTPTHTLKGGYGPKIQEVSGGAPDFLKFMKNELFPFMENNFRTNQKRVLVGHSFGGLFTSWVMLRSPRTFNGYIAISPSLWYDNHYLFLLEKETAQTVNDANLTLYLTVGNREINNLYNMPQDLRNFAKRLKSRNHQNLRMRYEVLSGETHNSIFPGAFTRGIRFILNEN
ncbi:MAG: alpha/beta hydrolase-fold protein [Balneolaceae bacterium]|jgi:predicted alpha/beta superfamily hydrolase